MKTCPKCEKILNEIKKTVKYWDKHYMFKAQTPKEIVKDFERILKLFPQGEKNEGNNPR